MEFLLGMICVAVYGAGAGLTFFLTKPMCEDPSWPIGAVLCSSAWPMALPAVGVVLLMEQREHNAELKARSAQAERARMEKLLREHGIEL